MICGRLWQIACVLQDESAEGRAKWERTFNVDWYGVYYGKFTRFAFCVWCSERLRVFPATPYANFSTAVSAPSWNH